MKKSLFSISAATLLAVTSIPAQALDDNLVYVAVEPCRIVDTRETTIMAGNESRNFKVSGDLSSQGGDVCSPPEGREGVEPLAASVYLVAVGGGVKNRGFLTAFPSDETAGTVATLNYDKNQIIGNTTIASLCQPSTCPPDGQLGLKTSDSQNVVIDVQGYYYPASGSCSADMVAVGNLCVDKYEASLVNSTGDPADGTTCNVNGSDCGANASSTAIFAQSVEGATPVSTISWYQAAQACANVGKRLPTTAEWQMAASGTVAGTGIAPDCNAPTSGGAVALTGASAACTSNTGAFDMVGNLWEFSADLDASQQSAGQATSTDDLLTVALGCSYNISSCDNDPSTSSMFVLANGPAAQNELIGFRCVR